jgi:hypothetical protein
MAAMAIEVQMSNIKATAPPCKLPDFMLSVEKGAAVIDERTAQVT